MVVVKCDRCGTTVDNLEDLKKVRRLKAYPVKDKPPFADNTLPEKFELCGDCYALVKELITQATDDTPEDEVEGEQVEQS